MAATATKGNPGDIRAGGAFVELYVKGTKAAGQAFKLAELQFRSFARTINRIAVSIRATLATINRSFVSFGRSISRIISTSRAAISAIGSKMVVGGGVGVGLLGFSVYTFAQFEETMSAVKAVSAATAQEFDRLNAKAKELGKTTRFTASQVGRAMFSMAQAGFKPNEIEGGIGHVLDLALAGALDIDVATDIAAKISIPFGIAAKDIDRVSDSIAMAANSSATNVEEMGYAFKYAAGHAAINSQSLEDMSAAMAVLANRAQNASTAGTQLRMIMMKFADEKVRKIIESYGVKIKDATGNMRPVLDILTEFEQATGKRMDAVDQGGLFSQLFGVRGATGALILAKNPRAIQEQRANQANAKGFAHEVGKIKADNLMGDFISLWSAIEAVQIALGDALMPTLRDLTQCITTQSRSLADWIGQNKELIVTIAKVAAMVLAGGAALMILGGGISFVATMLAPVGAVIGTVFTVLAGSLSILASIAGLVGTVVVGGFMMMAAAITGVIGIVGTAVTVFASMIPVIAAIGTSMPTFGVIFSQIALWTKAIFAGAMSIKITAGSLTLLLGPTETIGVAIGIIAYGLRKIVDSIKICLGGFFSFIKLITDIPNRFVRIFATAKAAFGWIIEDLRIVGVRFITVFQDIRKNAVALFGSLQESFAGIWNSLSIGDFATAMEIVWADLQLRFEQGKEFFNDFCTEVKAVFLQLAEILGFAFSEIVHSIKAEFFGFLLQMRSTAMNIPGVNLGAIGLEWMNPDIEKSVKAAVAESAGAQQKARREEEHKKSLSKIQGADWADTNPAIEAAKQSLADLNQRAKEKKSLSDAENAKPKWLESMDQAFGDLTPDWGKLVADTFSGPDPFGKMMQEIRDNFVSPSQAVHPALLTVGAFTGSQGTFSGLEAKGGGFRSVEGRLDNMVSLLEDIERNTAEGETYYEEA